ncbi:acyl-CoA dehydrogenase family protein [Spirillospora sp. NPDC048823]|uniref:acyl-CoA dehydrogenase family protein n=1 Tax=unclassified Spirillospora TaxID=2642701 RepID=UPI0037202126
MNPDVIGIPEMPEYLALPPTGLGAPLTSGQQDLLDLVRSFADEHIRPTGTLLDRLDPEEVIAADSPLWPFLRTFGDLGVTTSTIMQLPPADLPVLLPALWEELGAADAGLAITIGAGMLPSLMMTAWGRHDLLEKYPESLLGCWAITEPDHGSDMLDADGAAFHPEGEYGRPNLVAVRKGDRLVLDGQKSAWVSNGCIAQVAILYTAYDEGDGPRPGMVLLVPLDREGVSRGRPLDKLGQRSLNQGEIFFDGVELEPELVLAGPDEYQGAVYSILAEANASMGAMFTGVAREAYGLALAYAHTRRQGGVPIIRHQNVRARLFHMFRRVEVARSLARQVFLHNMTHPVPALQGSIASKITSTRIAFEVADDALQIFGGNGLSREYPMEKLLRDARASLIEDGCNELLAIKGGSRLVNPSLL